MTDESSHHSFNFQITNDPNNQGSSYPAVDDALKREVDFTATDLQVIENVIPTSGSAQ